MPRNKIFINKYLELSPIAEHAVFTKDGKIHGVDNDKFIVLEPEPRLYYRKFKESLYIRNCKQPKLNWNEGKEIDKIWLDLLGPHFSN